MPNLAILILSNSTKGALDTSEHALVQTPLQAAVRNVTVCSCGGLMPKSVSNTRRHRSNGFETIANAPHSGKVLGVVRVFFDLGPQTPHINGDLVGITAIIGSPHAVQ